MTNFTKEESRMLKGIAILFMVGLHLFNRVELEGFYKPWVMIGNYSLIYYISFIFDACVPIYCFCSGYGAYINKKYSVMDHLHRFKKLYINYVIVLLITCLLGLVLNHPNIPNSFYDFFCNLFLVKSTYVGSWWFMQTYLLLMVSAPILIKGINKINNDYAVLIGALIIYFVSYYFRILNPINIGGCVQLLINASVLYGTSFLSFVVGMLFYKQDVIYKIRKYCNDKKYSSCFISLLLFIFALISHVLVKSMIVAPFIAVVLIVAFSLVRFNEVSKRILNFFGNHSTNIWLVHMQCYMIFFSKIVFCTNTVIGAFIICLGMSLCLSYIIKGISHYC